MALSADELEAKLEVYYIPQNYEDAGGVFGGRFGTRNIIELAVLCGPIGILEYNLLHFSWQINVSIALLTLVPIAALCVFGIGGESLSQILVAAIRYRKRRRKLSYITFDLDEEIPKKKLSVRDSLSLESVKGALERFRTPDDEDEDYLDEEEKNRIAYGFRTPSPSNKVANSAFKEMLIRKLELSDDEDDYYI